MTEGLGGTGISIMGGKGKNYDRIASNRWRPGAGYLSLAWAAPGSQRLNLRNATGSWEEEPWELTRSNSKEILKRLQRMKHYETFWSNCINGKFSHCLCPDPSHWREPKERGGNRKIAVRTLPASPAVQSPKLRSSHLPSKGLSRLQASQPQKGTPIYSVIQIGQRHPLVKVSQRKLCNP